MRCFTILLGCGWLLFVPPRDGTYNENLPLAKWEHVGSYDSATQCENDKIGKTIALSKAFELTKQEPNKADLQVNTWAFARGRCIPSDALGFPLK